MATGGGDGSVKVWDIEKGFVTHNLKGHGSLISSLKFWGDYGSSQWWLASASDIDYKIRVWDLVKSRSIATLTMHDSVVRALDFSHDGKMLISGGRDKVINVWNINSKTQTNDREEGDKKKQNVIVKFHHQVTIPALDPVECLGFFAPGVLTTDPTEQIIYSGGEKGITNIWSLKDMKRLSTKAHRLEDSTEETSIQQMIYSPDRNILLNVLSDDTLLEIPLVSTELQVRRRIGGNHGEIIDCVFLGDNFTNEVLGETQDEEQYLAIATNSPEVRILKQTGLSHTVLSGHKDIVLAIDRSVDGCWLATAGKDGQAKLWNLQSLIQHSSGTLIDSFEESFCTFSGHVSSIGAIALPRTPTVINENSTDEEIPPPKFLVTGSQDLTVKVWIIPRNKDEKPRAIITRKAHEKDINAIDVSPDNRFFATASQDKTTKIWDIETGDSVAILSGHKRGVWSVKFNPYQKNIATSSGDKTVMLWNLNDYTPIRTFEGHTNSVLKLAFLTNGLQLASSGGDGLVKIWNTNTGECDVTLDNHEDKVWCLSMSEDDKTLMSGGGDGVITFWKDVTEDRLEEEREEENQLIEQQQQLENYVNQKDWKNAIILALSLNHPYQLLKLFSTVMEKNADPESITGLFAVDQAIAELGNTSNKDGEDNYLLNKLLTRVRDWNTNARTATVAQTVLHAIICHYNTEELCNLKELSSCVDGLLPYTERHIDRVEGLIEQSFMLDYVLQSMERVL